MKKLTIFAVTAWFLISAPIAHAGYFYLTAGVDLDNDGDPKLSTSASFSTLAACQAALPATAFQGCVASCDPTNPSVEYFLEQFSDGDKDDGFKGLYHGVGPYGYQADCEAGIADAAAAGMTDVLAACTVVTSKHSCR
jgi:hypothetical protein